MSLTWMLNNVGPSIEPWGTPKATDFLVETVSLMRTDCDLPLR